MGNFITNFFDDLKKQQEQHKKKQELERKMLEIEKRKAIKRTIKKEFEKVDSVVKTIARLPDDKIGTQIALNLSQQNIWNTKNDNIDGIGLNMINNAIEQKRKIINQKNNNPYFMNDVRLDDFRRYLNNKK